MIEERLNQARERLMLKERNLKELDGLLEAELIRKDLLQECYR